METDTNTNNSIGSTRIKHLDGWRGLAITFVLISHFFHSPIRQLGALGVCVFFVLSGMLMSNILFNKKTPLPIFFKRRISRIIPLFLLYVLFAYTYSLILNIDFKANEVIATSLFLRTYIPSDINIWDTQVPIGHIWSLNVEEHAYLMLSFITILPLIRKHPGIFLIGLGLLSQLTMLFYLTLADHCPQNYEIRTECAVSFIFYAAGYNLLKHHFRKFVHPSFPVFTFLFSILCFSGWLPWWSFFFTPALLSFTVNHLADTWSPLIKSLEWQPLRMLGIWSYSIYLWQQPFYQFKDHFPPGVALALALCVGVASFYFFENPSRNWINSRWQGK